MAGRLRRFLAVGLLVFPVAAGSALLTPSISAAAPLPLCISLDGLLLSDLIGHMCTIDDKTLEFDDASTNLLSGKVAFADTPLDPTFTLALSTPLTVLMKGDTVSASVHAKATVNTGGHLIDDIVLGGGGTRDFTHGDSLLTGGGTINGQPLLNGKEVDDVTCVLPGPVCTGRATLTFDVAPTQVADLVGSLTLSSQGGSGFINSFSVGFSEVVPEPSSLALFGTGLIGLGLFRRRG